MNSDLHIEIPLNDITWPDTTDISEQQIHDMATSILVHGQVEPIIVCPHNEQGKYRGVCGRLRYEGMKYRWRGEPEDKTILARIHQFKDKPELKMWQLVENLHRREVTAMQKAKQYRELFDLMKTEHKEEATLTTLATAIEDCTGNKESLKTIQHYLSLTNLPTQAQDILTSEKMPLRYGLELLRIEDPKRQVKAAEEIRKRPDQFRNAQAVKGLVETYITDQQRDKQRKRLKKKVEELSKQGKTVIIEAPYGDLSYKEREKYTQFYGEIPADCKDCQKIGIMLSGNFQQKPICTDHECYDNIQAQKNRKHQKDQKELEQKLDAERSKVYAVEFDARHWRLAVYALINTWLLTKLLHVKASNYAKHDEVVWMTLNKLDEKQCQQILVKHAIEKVLSPPQEFHLDSPAKQWTVKEFGLTPQVFLNESKRRKSVPKRDAYT